MKIAIALSRFPLPTDKGDKLRIFSQIKYLAARYELHVVCVTDIDVSDAHRRELERLCKSLTVIPLGKAGIVARLAGNVVTDLPFQAAYFRSSRMKQTLEKLIERERIDLVYVQLIRAFESVPFVDGVAYYLDYMDDFSIGLSKRAASASIPNRWVLASEARRVLSYEQRIARKLHGYSIITKHDARQLGEEINAKIDVIPNGISSDAFEVTPVESTYDLLFLGNLSYFPNARACRYLVEKLLPELNTMRPGLKVALVGKDPTADVLAYRSKQVVVTGFVADPREYLAKAKLFVAPLFEGQGLQNKFLEAMAAGLPVITTTHAAEGLEAQDRRGVVSCDTTQEFVSAILALLDDGDNRRQLGDEGRQFVKDNYDWGVHNAKLAARFETLVRRERAPSAHSETELRQ